MSLWTRFFQLRARLIVAFSAMIMLVTFSFSWAIKWRGQSLAEAALVKRATGFTEVLARLLAPAAAQGHSQEVQRLLSFVHDYADLRYVTVLGAKGEILARWSPSPLRPGEEFLEEAHSPRVVMGEGKQGMLHILAPVRANDVHLGTVITGFSRQSTQQILRTVDSALWSVAAGVLALAVLVAHLLARFDEGN
jgi:sensor histidine kinase regulating citrate/malate metabolism